MPTINETRDNLNHEKILPIKDDVSNLTKYENVILSSFDSDCFSNIELRDSLNLK
jgi:hypothetical protein